MILPLLLFLIDHFVGGARIPSEYIGARDSSLFFFKSGARQYDEVLFKENIVDLALGQYLYLLTDRNLYKIEAGTREIIDQSNLPYHASALRLLASRSGKDSLLILLTSDELSLIEPGRLSYLKGVGIPPGDREILFTQTEGFIYLNLRGLNHSLIEIYGLVNGKRMRGLKLDLIKRGVLNALKGFIYLQDMTGSITKISVNLRSYKKIFSLSDSTAQFLLYGSSLVVSSRTGLHVVDISTDKVTESRPIRIDEALPIDGDRLFAFSFPDSINRLGQANLIDLETMTSLRTFEVSESLKPLFAIDTADIVLEKDGQFVNLAAATGEFFELKPVLATLTSKRRVVRQADSCFYIQLGAFTRRDRAFALVEDLSHKGIPALCDSSSDLFKIRIGGFIDREDAILCSITYPGKNWLVYTRRDLDWTTEKGQIVALNNQKNLLIFEAGTGIWKLVHSTQNIIDTYRGSAILKDSVVEIDRLDGKKSVLIIKEGGMSEEIKDLQN